jgi:LETM1-like protein
MLVLLLSCSRISARSSTSAVVVPSSVVTPDVLSSGDQANPVAQLFGFVKDSFVRTVDGVGLMCKNYGRCNEIRAKQKQHRDLLRTQWENDGLTNQVIKQRLKGVNGGITYDEYAFLIKGKEDRSKLTQLIMLSWGAPRFLPYALMFYPEMLPSAFALQGSTSDKMETLSRQRSHAVILTLMNVENDAKVVPALAKLNIFGRKQQERNMEEMQRVSQVAGSLFVTPVKNQTEGAELALKTLEGHIYSGVDFSTKSKRLVNVPKSIVKGLARTLEGNSPLDNVFPHFFTRGKVLNHIRKVTDSDEFLVNEPIQLEQLGKQRLIEACNDRLIGGISRSDEEMRESLADWLDQVVVRPSDRVRKTGEFYNGNLARAAMMCYHAAQAAKDERSASSLLRLLFQGGSLKDGESKMGRFFSSK